MKRINDSPLFQFFQVVLLEEGVELLLNLRTLRIKKKQGSIVMEKPSAKADGEAKKALHLLIP